MSGLPPGVRPWSGNNGRGPPGAPPGGATSAPRVLPGLEGPNPRRKNHGRAKSANPPMNRPRMVSSGDVGQDMPAKMALARTVADLDRKLHSSSLEMQEKENSLFAKSGQVDALSQTVEFQQIKLTSLDLSLKLKEKEVKTLASQLRKQKRLIRRLERSNNRLATGGPTETGTESDTGEETEGTDDEEEDEQAAAARPLQVHQPPVRALPPPQQLQDPVAELRRKIEAAAATAAADAEFDQSAALSIAPPVLVSPADSAQTVLLEGGALVIDDEDGTEWFPIEAMCAASSEFRSQQPIPLDLSSCSLGQTVRILDVNSLKAAIETHSVEDEMTFEWAPEDAQWAGRLGVLVQVNAHGFARVDFSALRNNETTASFPEGLEGLESPTMSPGNTLDASAFQSSLATTQFQTTTSSMSSLPTIHLNETFSNMRMVSPDVGGGHDGKGVGREGGGGGGGGGKLLPLPMFHSSMPSLPHIGPHTPGDTAAGSAQEASRSMERAATCDFHFDLRLFYDCFTTVLRLCCDFVVTDSRVF